LIYDFQNNAHRNKKICFYEYICAKQQIMKLKIFCLGLLATIFANSTSAQKRKSIPSDKPQLIIGIVIEGMRYDYIYRYWDNFGEGGFRRLIEEGAVCRNANYSYMLTQTSPGYATIATGCNPITHGIVSNEWYMQLQEQRIGSVFDAKEKSIGTQNDSYKFSPRNILTTTFTDELQIFNNKNSKVMSISLNPASAILAAGHMGNAAYWFDDVSGNWVTSSYYADSLPRWLTDFNAKRFPDMYIEKDWLPMLSADKYRAGSEKGKSRNTGFTDDHVLGKKINSFMKKNKQYSRLKANPSGNTLTKDLCVNVIMNENLGQDETTDYLNVAFTASDYVSNACGPNSVELEDLYLRLDKDLEHFLQFIDENVGKNNTLIYLTSDHGASNNPTHLQENNIPAGFFNADRAVMLLGTYLNAKYDKGKWVSAYHNNQIYLNHNLIESSGISLQEFENTVCNFMLQFSGVADAVSASTLRSTTFTNGAMAKMQNSFNPKRSGDVIICLEPGWIEQSSGVSSSNSGYNYDTHVPLIWYGWKIKRTRINQPVDMRDIAPTIANFLDIPFPNGTSGNVIEGLIQ